jgi:hypothetical protein
MKAFFESAIASFLIICLMTVGSINGQPLNDFMFKGSFDSLGNVVNNKFQFNGYTNYWQNDYKE